jgi:CSLREA domain-containing protein/uncharacterized repeat protein (TIGR01451 family)
MLLPSWIGPTSPVYAVAISVNSTADEPDTNPGDSMCASTPSGACTLRAAVMEANALGGSQTVQVPAGTFRLTIAGGDDTAEAGDLDVTGDLHVIGAGSASTFVQAGLDAATALDRVFDVRSGGSLHLESMTVRFGKPTSGAGGGIASLGSLVLSSVEVSDNLITGIYGSVTMTSSTITRNSTPDGPGGGIRGGVVHLTSSTVSNNSAQAGGGIHASTVILVNSVVRGNTSGIDGAGISACSVTSTDSTISENHAGAAGTHYGGGGIGAGGACGTVSLTRTTVNGNSATGSGGGIVGGPVIVLNSTLAGNSAGDDGGALFGGPFTIKSSTIADNTAGKNGGALRGGSTTLSNTIVADNSEPACSSSGPVTSLGFNLDTGTSCGSTGAGDVTSTAPELGPLADNGGPTKTRALLPGSPAIDGGNPAGCTDAANQPLVTDQRGLPRPRNGDATPSTRCDIGAFELQDPYQADLGIAATDAPDPATVGGQVSYGLTVANTGPARATGVVVTAPVPSAATVISANSSQGTCSQAATTVSCQVGSLDPGGQAAVTVVVTPTQPGTLSFTPSVSNTGGQIDPSLSNNAGTAITTVTGPSTACSPRPRVAVQVQSLGSGRLRATLTASTNAGQVANTLGSIQITRVDNATIDVPSQPGVATARNGLGAGQTVTITPAQTTVFVEVQRTNAGAFTGHFAIADGCSPAWPTFVGGGTGVP